MDFPHPPKAAHKTCRPAATWRSTWRPKKNHGLSITIPDYQCSEGGLWGYSFFSHFLEPTRRRWISDGICWWNRRIWMWSLMEKCHSASRISFSVKLATGHACRFYVFNKFNGFNRTRQCKLYKVVLPSHKVVYNPHENYRNIMIYYL